MTFRLRGKKNGDEQLVEWTNILSKIKLRTDNQNKDNKTAITHQETTKEINMSKQHPTDDDMAPDFEEHLEISRQTSSLEEEIRQGRRAGTNTANLDDDDLLDSLVPRSDSGPIPPDDMPPRPSRRQGGWASETTSKEKKKTTGQDVEAFEEDERFRMDNTVSKDDDNDILVIPDLEEVQEEDMATQIAAPPSVQVNRVATYKELDNYLQKHAALFTLDGEIDLKLLSNVLSPETEVFEEDKAWDWDRLFTEVASELQSEWDRETEARSESTEKT